MTLSYADIASTVAIFLSIFALFQTGSHRTRDLAIQARKDLEQILRGLASAADRISDATEQWKHALAARGMHQSGVMIQKEQTADELRLRTSQLSVESAALRVPSLPIISSFTIDQYATEVGTCMLKWAMLSSDIETFASEAKENRERLSQR